MTTPTSKAQAPRYDLVALRVFFWAWALGLLFTGATMLADRLDASTVRAAQAAVAHAKP